MYKSTTCLSFILDFISLENTFFLSVFQLYSSSTFCFLFSINLRFISMFSSFLIIKSSFIEVMSN